MKVTHKEGSVFQLAYRDIPTGAAFEGADFEDSVFIKTDKDCLAGKGSVELSSGDMYAWPDSATGFRIVDAEVVVHG